MGILNVTPDSFWDGGLFVGVESALKRALQMRDEGAGIIDVGGESTRPGADPVSADEEIRRVVPVIEAIGAQTDVPISIDTMKADVAAAAIEAGAVIVNDVSAMRFDARMARIVADSGAGVVLMHMLGEPRTMQQNPVYSDVVAEVLEALLGWAHGAQESGIESDRIAIDPGIGFGKTVEHNLSLIKAIGRFGEAGYPVLAGPSRKSFIGAILNRTVERRLEGTAAAVAWLAAHGANILRVHDVGPMTQVVRMTEAIDKAG